jgi:three-Cys-motif partner protein
MPVSDSKNSKVVPDAYRHGRELAYIKHQLLEAYLEKLFMIVGMSSNRLGITELCYVDCFAGPWSDDSEDMASTSIAISLQILDRCQQALHRRGVNLHIRALYIEKDKAAFARLQQFLSSRTPSGISAEGLPGNFVALREQILDRCGNNSFAFFFIDPTGWKDVGVTILQPLLQRKRSEFLINFMYDFVNRTASMSDWKEEIAAFLGETVDIDNFHGLEREKLLLNTYRKNLKQHLRAEGRWHARSAYVRVLDRQKERPKYHLVYLTTHPRGTIEFMEISENLDQVQKHVRASTKQNARIKKSGMGELFGPEVFVNAEEGHASLNEVEGYWLEYLAGGEQRVGEEEFANLLEDTDWFPGDFQRALGSLINAGKVRNLDATRKRPKKPLHWEKEGERLQLTGGPK